MADPRGWFILGAIIGIVGGAFALFFNNSIGFLFLTSLGGFFIMWGVVDALGDISENTQRMAEVMAQLVENENGIQEKENDYDPAYVDDKIFKL